MNNEIFWLRLWQSVIAGLIIIILTIASCSSYDTAKRAEAIKSGMSSNQIGCVFSPAAGETCALAAMERKP